MSLDDTDSEPELDIDDAFETQHKGGLMDLAEAEPFHFLTVVNDKNACCLEIEINSAALITMLKDACTKYPGTEYKSLFRSRVTLREPFMMLFYNLDKIRELALEARGLEKSILGQLLDFMRLQGSWIPQHRLETIVCHTIAFRDIWLLYRPGTTVYQRLSNEIRCWRAFKIGNISYRQHSEDHGDNDLEIQYYSLAFDKTGSSLVPRLHTILLKPFVGERLIADLELVPESLMSDNQVQPLRKCLVKRGRKYWSFHGKAVCQNYQGNAWRISSELESFKVVIDYATTSKAPFSDHLRDAECFTPASGCACAPCLHKYAALPSYPLEISRDVRSCSRDLYPMLEPPFDQDGHLPNPFLFCPTHVDAFSFQYRSWRLVEIKALTDLEKSLELMDSLVMDERSKVLLDARIEESLSAHRVGMSKHGMTILLQGQSGTGKTSTANAIAEAKGMAIYTHAWPDLSCRRFEAFTNHIDIILREAKDWGAILAIDDAEMLLQPLVKSDYKLEMYASILISKLDQFGGVLLLMARPSDNQINEAIRSRIHLTIQLPSLTAEARAKIWTNIVKATATKTDDQQSLANLTTFVCNYNLNGHQLRNCIRTILAYSNCSGNDKTNQKKHLEQALAHDVEFLYTGQSLRRTSAAHVDSASSSMVPKYLPSPTLRSGSILRQSSYLRNIDSALPARTRLDQGADYFSSRAPMIPALSSPTNLPSNVSTPAHLSPSSTALLSPSIAPSAICPRSPRPSPVRPSRSSRPGILRRHSTQSSLDASALNQPPPAALDWTWKMLPAHVRRPQLEFEKGLPASGSDTDGEKKEREGGGGSQTREEGKRGR